MLAVGGVGVRVSGVLGAAPRTINWVVFGVLPIVIFSWWLLWAVHSPAGDWAFDFRQFWQGGNDVVNGVSPYPSSEMLARSGDELGPTGIQEVFRFPYPAGAAIVLAPLGALDFDLAAALWSVLLVASLIAAVLILGVRDWRVMGVVIGSAPAIGAVRLGTLTPVLVLLLAVIWRWRERWLIAGGALAVAIALKLFLWPLVVWLAATRRFAAAAFASILAVTSTLAAWAVIGFDGLADYPELLRRLSDVVADRGFSPVALGVEAGLSQDAASALQWLIGLGLLVGVWLTARREPQGCCCVFPRDRRCTGADSDRLAPLLRVARRTFGPRPTDSVVVVGSPVDLLARAGAGERGRRVADPARDRRRRSRGDRRHAGFVA